MEDFRTSGCLDAFSDSGMVNVNKILHFRNSSVCQFETNLVENTGRRQVTTTSPPPGLGGKKIPRRKVDRKKTYLLYKHTGTEEC